MKRNLTILTLITVAVLAAAGLAVRGRGTGSEARAEPSRLFHGLVEQVNDVATIEVSSAGGTVTIRRVDGAWTVSERGGYPAKFNTVKELLVSLAELDIVEPKTARPENYAKLGVEAPDAEGSASKQVVLRDEAGSILADLIVGQSEYRRGGQETYVRPADDPRAYLVAGGIEPATDPAAWIDTEIVRLESAELAAVRVVHSDGEEIALKRYDSTSTQFKVANLPLGGEERYEGVGNGVATALNFLSLDDVRPLDEVDFAANPILSAEFQKEDGTVLDLHLARADEKHWVRLAVRHEAPDPATAAPPSMEGEEEGEAPAEEEPDAAALEAARTAALELDARLSPWAFAIPEYKATALSKRMVDLLAEEPAAGPPGPGDGAAEVPEPIEEPDESAPESEEGDAEAVEGSDG